MKKIITAIALLLLTVVAAGAQDNEIKRIPNKGYDPNQQQYETFRTGFWAAAEVVGGVSCNHKSHNLGFSEVDVTAGYRFSQYFKAGIGIGARYYINQGNARRGDIKWGMPLFATVRGNLMPGEYRNVVPYYQVEVGGSIRDGFMFRPGLGLRIGEPRNAFTVAINYMGQDLATYNKSGAKATKYTNFVALRLGYEF